MSAPRTRSLPVVALVGRTNVGKSTLWNRLTETGRALVSEEAHTTRDRNYAPVVWRGMAFDLVDTGGMDVEAGEVGAGIRRQAGLAIRDADLVIFLIDAKVGILDRDRELAKEVKALHRHVVLLANKADNLRVVHGSLDNIAKALGWGMPAYASATTGRGVGDALDRVHEELARMDKPPVPVEEGGGLKLVVMGRANVGKSSLVNAILGEERVIVSPVPHTTREPIDTHLVWKDEFVTLVDTAGMRKRATIKPGLEEEALERNRRALARADVAFLVFDATEDPRREDKRLAGLMEEETKGLVLVANKWDLVEAKQTGTADEYERRLRRSLPFLKWAPMVFTSATERLRATKLLDIAFTIREERRRQISYNALQRFLKTVVARKKPLAEIGTHSPYLYDVVQTGIEPPSFLITVRGQKESVHVSWIRYFENRLREKFGFGGTPIVVKVRNVPAGKLEEKEGDDRSKKKNRRKRPIGRKGFRY